MVELTHLSESQKAVRLICKGLSPKASALRGDSDYEQLLAHWRADPDFQALVRDLAPMLEVRVVDVLDYAIVLAPLNADSIFAATISDLRSNLNDMTRGALALIQVAIAATFFPTASELTGTQSDTGEMSATPPQIAKLLRDQCQRLEAQASNDPDLEEAGLVAAWRELARLPEVPPDGSQRAAMSSLTGMVKIVLNQLHQHGMLQSFDTGEGEAYTPTPRYRRQVRELAANELFERCAAAIPGFLDREER